MLMLVWDYLSDIYIHLLIQMGIDVFILSEAWKIGQLISAFFFSQF